jgi:hypothetical protein
MKKNQPQNDKDTKKTLEVLDLATLATVTGGRRGRGAGRHAN